MKGAEVNSGSFVTQFQATIVAKPRHRALDDVAGFAKAAPVRTTSEGQQTRDQHADHELDDPFEPVSAVALYRLRLRAFLALLVRQMRKLLEHGLEQFLIALVGGAGLNDKRDAMGVAN